MKIKPTYVTLEQAKLLKKKGADIECKTAYESNSIFYSRPEQWQVVEWLRVKHGIWVWVENYNDKISYVPQIPKADLPKVLGYYHSPQEAYSAAFDYILNNLI